MTTHQQIVKAIGTHGMWKARLQKAVDQGVSDVSATVVRQDNQCDFGKWLYSPDLAAEAKHSPHYEKCRVFHGQFHLAAAKVLTLALANKKGEATRAMGPGGEFATCSATLTKAMMDWDKEAPH
jgi:hypothetical protein